MSADVVSLKGGAIRNQRREAFLQTVAASFDLYVERHEHEPDAIVYVMCGIMQPSQIAWDIRGVSIDGPTSVLSIAAVHCQAEAATSRQGISR